MRQIGQLYPQSVFGRACIDELRTRSLGHSLLDVPCGRGETTYEFARAFPSVSVVGIDVDEDRIRAARARYSRPNLEFSVDEIERFLGQVADREVGAICLINSLFLLENADLVVNRVSQCLKSDGVFLCVVPNVDSANFHRFQQLSPGVNKLVLSSDHFSEYFGRFGLNVRNVKGIVFAGTFAWRWTRFLGPLRSQVLALANVLLSLTRKATPCYFVIVLEPRTVGVP